MLITTPTVKIKMQLKLLQTGCGVYCLVPSKMLNVIAP